MREREELDIAQALPLIAIGFALLALGGWMYAAYRPGTLLCSICQGPYSSSAIAQLPEFVVYCLPNGLWSLASILMLHPLLRNEAPIRRIATVSLVPILGIGSELLQAVGMLPGVFDPFDLACYAIPLIIYLFIQLIRRLL